jgi:hypothetical protein
MVLSFAFAVTLVWGHIGVKAASWLGAPGVVHRRANDALKRPLIALDSPRGERLRDHGNEFMIAGTPSPSGRKRAARLDRRREE